MKLFQRTTLPFPFEVCFTEPPITDTVQSMYTVYIKFTGKCIIVYSLLSTLFSSAYPGSGCRGKGLSRETLTILSQAISTNSSVGTPRHAQCKLRYNLTAALSWIFHL